MNPSITQQITVGLRRLWGEAVIDRFRLWSARVHGVEVTQAIQYHRADEHLTDAADRGPDNTVQLVAYKAAWVRVYVRSGLFSALPNVTGTLEVARRNHLFAYDLVSTYTPQGVGAVTAEQSVDYDTERNNLNRTLNFLIPAREFYGTLRLTVRLVGLQGAEKTIVVNGRLIQTLRVRAILVAYNGPSTAATPAPGQPPVTQLTLPPPTLADLQNTASMALAAMPVQATGSFASAGTLNWATPIDDMRTAPGECSTNWDVLLNWLALLQDNDGNRADVVYYGLLPAGIPIGVPGCGENGLGAGRVGDQLTLLHEIGHGYGFGHTPCGPAGATDPNYPTYEPYASASIGEFGLDVRNGAIFDPSTDRDYMSYCNPRWMSLYQHARLLQHPRLAPRWLTERSIFDDYPHVKPFDLEHSWWPDPPWLSDDLLDWKMNPVISIIGEVREDGAVQVSSVARIHAASQPSGVETHWVAQLIDEAGNAIARGLLFRRDHHGGCGCGSGSGCKQHDDPDRPPFTFKVYVPNVAPGEALRILRAGNEVWARKAPPKPTRFERAAVDVNPTQQLELTWHVESEGEVDIWAQWTNDQGGHWHGLAVGLKHGRAELPLTGLPGGRIAVRLQAHDGFFTAESELLMVELPERAPEIAILYPRNEQTLRVGQPIQIAGNATNTEGVPLPTEALTWTLNGASVGRGRELWITTPEAGRHELALNVRWKGGTAQRFVVFTIGPKLI